MFMLVKNIFHLLCVLSFLEHVQDDEGSCVSSEEAGPAGHTQISALINDAYEVCVCGSIINNKCLSAF